MKCIFCNHEESKVIDSREAEEAEVIRRRRECLKCEERFTTYERIEKPDLMVIKKDKRRELFDRQKLMKGISRACEKRSISADQMEALIDAIEKDARNINSVEVSSQIIGELVMKHLRSIDEVAYVRFASVYREFKDAKEFMDELKTFMQGKKQSPKITLELHSQ